MSGASEVGPLRRASSTAAAASFPVAPGKGEVAVRQGIGDRFNSPSTQSTMVAATRRAVVYLAPATLSRPGMPLSPLFRQRASPASDNPPLGVDAAGTIPRWTSVTSVR